MTRNSAAFGIATLCAALAACGTSNSGTGGDNGTGGTPASGGGSGKGGSVAAGGTTGAGGAGTGTAGVSGAGGTTGATGAGGTAATGGTMGAGGTAATGGTTGGGGSVATGGDSGAGGAAGGGGSGKGGASGTGGAPGGTGGKGGAGGTSGGGQAGGSGGGVSTGGMAGGAAGGSGAAFPFNPAYMLGADITWTLEDESAGATYSDGGKVQPLEQIMANYGFNYIRIRTFVNPSDAGGYSPGLGFGDIAHTVTWAKRVKACGMGILLDFHMSDTWASIGVQDVPAAWAGLSASAMDTAAHDYVKSSLAQMVAAGVEPDMVQIGNETDSHMSGVGMSPWANFANLVNAGIQAVRETDPRIIVIAQNGRPRPSNGESPDFNTWVDWYLKGNPSGTLPVDEDGICGSTYGTTTTPAGGDWTTSFSYVIDTYNKPVWSCEYSNVHVDAINGVMRALPKNLGRGTFIWEPTRYPELNGGATGTNSVLFSNTGGNGGKYVTNAAIAEYATLAKSYGLPVPSGTCH
jgi:arabinogalactan endo-1,4-beta-galactosidase